MKQETVKRILQLKEEKNAVILAHNYQIPEVQDIADYVGDSLGLSRQAADISADTIVFCGVHFMAETAKILSPKKTVILPDRFAGCPMSDMITADKLRALKKQHPEAMVVCYVNTTAEIKAESDCCCTSANAVEVVSALRDSPEIIFVPDKYLGAYVSKMTGKDLILWEGFCPTHAGIKPEDILEKKEIHPDAKVMVHPECPPRTIELADAVLSTGGMCTYSKENKAEKFIVATENSMLYRLKKENPMKTFYPASDNAICPTMKMINLKKIEYALENTEEEILVPEDIRIRAKRSLDRMLEL